MNPISRVLDRLNRMSAFHPRNVSLIMRGLNPYEPTSKARMHVPLRPPRKYAMRGLGKRRRRARRG